MHAAATGHNGTIYDDDDDASWWAWCIGGNKDWVRAPLLAHELDILDIWTQLFNDKMRKDDFKGRGMILECKCKLCAWKAVNMHYLAYTYTPPYALHRPLLPICAPRAGIPSKTDHRVRKLTYTLQPGGGRPYNRQREKGGRNTYLDDMRTWWI